MKIDRKIASAFMNSAFFFYQGFSGSCTINNCLEAGNSEALLSSILMASGSGLLGGIGTIVFFYAMRSIVSESLKKDDFSQENQDNLTVNTSTI